MWYVSLRRDGEEEVAGLADASSIWRKGRIPRAALLSVAIRMMSGARRNAETQVWKTSRGNVSRVAEGGMSQNVEGEGKKKK